MEGFINPKCNVPLFALPTIDDAKECGSTGGTIFAVILTLIIVIVCGVLIYKNHNPTPKPNTPQEKVKGVTTMDMVYGGVGLGLIILSWMYIPSLMSWTRGRSWEGYNAQIESFVKSGSTREQAINKVQELYQATMQAQAIENAGRNISRGMQRINNNPVGSTSSLTLSF